jgi:OmpA-OmpF porin, OOP family
MKRYLLAATALAAVAIATPAAARDRSAYFGLEVGALKVSDTDVDFSGLPATPDWEIDHKTGVDGDMIAGYDFGMFRAEAELGYKRSEHDEYEDVAGSFDADGRSSVYSLMANAMVDVGQDEGVSFYAGAGIGYAQVIHRLNDGITNGDRFKIKDRGLAWQAIAGVRAVVSQYFDVGLKYRYFNASNVDDDDGTLDFDTDYKSHSLLVSLIHNFNSPLPPPPPPPVVVAPPPPPPPATQTCPDGSVILATDACPLPPPPPPPPPPEPERG